MKFLGSELINSAGETFGHKISILVYTRLMVTMGFLHSISQEGGLSPAAIAGIAVGAVAGVGGIAAVVVVLVLFVF